MNRFLMVVLTFGVAGMAAAGQAVAPESVRLPLQNDGTIPAWLVAGPFEQGTQGFGDWRSVDAIGEDTVSARTGAMLSAPLVSGGRTTWDLQSVDARGYLDLNRSLGWAVPGRTPEQVWWAKAGYASVRLESPVTQQLTMLVGSNSQLAVFVNGTRVYEYRGQRDAVRDDDTVALPLVGGVNTLLLKIGNTHSNHRSPFFGGISFGWGTYCRVVTPDGRIPRTITAVFDGHPASPRMRLHSTFFFRRSGGVLVQRHDVEFFSPGVQPSVGSITFEADGKIFSQPLDSVRWGWNRVPVWYPAVANDRPVRCGLTLGDRTFFVVDTLRAERRFELQLVFLTHTDIGYTHPQPVVKELHCLALDQVLALCRKHPDFRWTIETVWQLEQYRQSRSPEVLNELYRYMREGRIALSPVSTNPYTGWVSEEEMIRAMYPGRDIRQQLGIATPGAVYNDVPGLAWMMPRVLHDAGVRLLLCGLNEVYGGYTLQRALPKAFLWEGGDGTRLAVYRNETYSEGTDYGLERDANVIAHRMWERLLRLRAAGEDRSMVLLNAAWFDNGPPAAHQFEMAKKWNAEFAYPRFVVTTLAEAATAFLREYGASLPVLRGDWTSSWDMLYQGEPARVAREREVQQRLIAAEALDAFTTVAHPEILPASRTVDRAYAALLEYSGHGSGLEAGFGTPADNVLTMQVREEYLRQATGLSTEVGLRALTRIVRAEEDFALEGLIVLNPLSWSCTVPVQIELKDSSSAQFHVTDLETGRVLPSFRRGHRLSIVTEGLPPMGFRKYRTAPAAGVNAESPDLRFDGSSLENVAYRITFDSHRGRITSIRDKRIGRELVDSCAMPFNEPLVQRGIAEPGFRVDPGDSVACAVIDERPVRLVLSFHRSRGVVRTTEYVLWTGLDRVDITHTLDLERLHPPKEVEVYAVGFPFALHGSRLAFMDVLGGYLEAGRDRLPGALKDTYSIRRSAAVTDGRTCINIAAADARVMFWKDDSLAGGPVLLANLVNNFPTEWNRNEENAGLLSLRYAFRSARGPFDADGAARLGWELQTEFPGRATLLRNAPAGASYLSVTGRNVLLTGAKSGAKPGEIILRISNVSPDSEAQAIVTSSLLLPAEVFSTTLLETNPNSHSLADRSVRVGIRPSETQTLLLRRKGGPVQKQRTPGE